MLSIKNFLSSRWQADPAKLFEVDFARGVLTFCMAEGLKAGHLYKVTVG